MRECQHGGKRFVQYLVGSLFMTSVAGCQGVPEESKPVSDTSATSSVTTLNPQRYDFEGKTVTIASTYIKTDGMVPDRITDTYRLLKRIEEVQTAFYVNVVFKEVDAGNYY